MKYAVNLRVYNNAELVYGAFLPELKEASSKRSSFSIKKHKDHVEFIIEADDTAALRATFNGITKLLAVHEKIG